MTPTDLIIPVFIMIVIIAVLARMRSNQGQITDSPDYRIEGPLLSNAERSFFGVLQLANNGEFELFSKVRVADILTPQKGLSRSQWQRAFNAISAKHFDFVLCDKSTTDIVLVIELDDLSHNQKNRQQRDDLIDKACLSASLPILRVKASSGYSLETLRDDINNAIPGREMARKSRSMVNPREAQPLDSGTNNTQTSDTILPASNAQPTAPHWGTRDFPS